MKCLFSHYFSKNYIPNYVIYYLEKLQKECDVILLTNDRRISNINVVEELGIKYYTYENRGYDFGMYYKYLLENQINVDRLILANDSMVLFDGLSNIFKWIKTSEENMLSITDSLEINYHLQSYFLVLDKMVQKELVSYLLRKGIKDDFQQTIYTYELDFSNMLLDEGYTLKSMYSYNDFSSETKQNPVIFFPEKLINNGLPMIKRKVIFNTFNHNERSFLQSLNYNFKKDFWKLINQKKEDTLNIKYINQL